MGDIRPSCHFGCRSSSGVQYVTAGCGHTLCCSCLLERTFASPLRAVRCRCGEAVKVIFGDRKVQLTAASATADKMRGHTVVSWSARRPNISERLCPDTVLNYRDLSWESRHGQAVVVLYQQRATMDKPDVWCCTLRDERPMSATSFGTLKRIFLVLRSHILVTGFPSHVDDTDLDFSSDAVLTEAVREASMFAQLLHVLLAGTREWPSMVSIHNHSNSRWLRIKMVAAYVMSQVARQAVYEKCRLYFPLAVARMMKMGQKATNMDCLRFYSLAVGGEAEVRTLQRRMALEWFSQSRWMVSRCSSWVQQFDNLGFREGAFTKQGVGFLQSTTVFYREVKHQQCEDIGITDKELWDTPAFPESVEDIYAVTLEGWQYVYQNRWNGIGQAYGPWYLTRVMGDIECDLEIGKRMRSDA